MSAPFGGALANVREFRATRQTKPNQTMKNNSIETMSVFSILRGLARRGLSKWDRKYVGTKLLPQRCYVKEHTSSYKSITYNL